MLFKRKNTIFYILICCVGVAVEYFDFIIFALLAPYIGENFFPGEHESVQLLKTFMIFSLGYIVRPIGGVFLGHLSDKFGRKKILVSSIILTAIATLGIGSIPSYQEVGVLATAMLVVFRVIQGIAHGAEKPIAITYISELHIDRKGFYCSLLYSSASFGGVCSLVFCFLLEKYLSDSEIVSWGWRLPFISGGFLAVLGIVFRYYAMESPVFNNLGRYKNEKILEQLMNNISNIIVGTLITLLVACLVVMGLFIPSFLNNYLQIPHEEAFQLSLIGKIYYACILPILGFLYSYGSRKKIFTYSAVVILVSTYFITQLLIINTYYSVLLYIVLLKTLLASLGASYPIMLSELFEDKFRNTGVAISYNIAFSISSLLPLLFLKNMKNITDDLYIIIMSFMLISLMALFAVYYEKVRIKKIT